MRPVLSFHPQAQQALQAEGHGGASSAAIGHKTAVATKHTSRKTGRSHFAAGPGSAAAAGSAAAMLDTLQRLNAGATFARKKPAAAGKASSGSSSAKLRGSAVSAASPTDIPPSLLLSDSTPFAPGDFYVFDDGRFRYVHRRPLRPAPLTEIQRMADATMRAAEEGKGPYVTLPLKYRKPLPAQRAAAL